MIHAKVAASFILLSLPPFRGTAIVRACHFAGGAAGMPADHPNTGTTDQPRPSPNRRLRMASLREDDATRERLADIVSRRAEETKDQRSLLTGQCFTLSVYDEIRTDIEDIASGIADLNDRGHFFGGIVRLAAHDFMDHDSRPDHNDGLPLGSDGCIDWGAADNSGLETIWCDDAVTCPLWGLYDTVYADLGVGRADFWVAAANAVVRASSVQWTDSEATTHADLDLPFRYGRTDRDDCSPGTVDSAHRLPGAQHCDQVEKTFITQMGLSWRDATALLGAHTLGFGSADFSGHDGMWMDEEEETVKFNKRYYEEILRRAWRPRNADDANLQDWTWAGNNGGNPRFMLNADLCLAFDIDDSPNCCTRIRAGANNVSGEVFCVDPALNLEPEEIDVTACNSSVGIRQEAREAVDEFAVNVRANDASDADNRAFYEAFAAAWQSATEAGYAEGTLLSLADTCDPTPEPTQNPTDPPTFGPSASPTESPTAAPTPDCEDVDWFINNLGKNRTCEWAVGSDRCIAFGPQYCPVSCQMCGCVPQGWTCTLDSDCCSNDCRGNNKCRASEASA